MGLIEELPLVVNIRCKLNKVASDTLNAGIVLVEFLSLIVEEVVWETGRRSFLSNLEVIAEFRKGSQEDKDKCLELLVVG